MHKKLRARLTVSVAGALAMVICATSAQAQGGAASAVSQGALQNNINNFDIAAQPLSNAMISFGQQAKLQISAASDELSNIQSAGVKGSYSVSNALDIMLAGTGVSWRVGRNDVVVLSKGTASATGRTRSALTEGQEEGGVRAASSSSSSSSSNSAVSLGPVRVGADGQSMPEMNPLTTREVTAEDFDRRNPNDISEVFVAEPGVTVGGSVSAIQKVYVNGVEEVHLITTIDGARQNNKVFHHNATNLIDPALLKVARVDPGVAPADAGPGALAGSIAYETKDVSDLLAPGKTIGGMLEGGFEDNGDVINGSASVYIKTGGFEALGYINRVTGDDYTAGNGEEMSGTAADLISGLGKIAFEASSGHRFELNYEQVKDDGRRPFRANFLGLVGRPDSVRIYDLDRQNITFSYTDASPEGLWDPELILAFSETDIEVLDPYGSTASTRSYSGKFQNAFPIGIGAITAGADFYDDQARYVDPSSDFREKSTNIGGFVQARLEPVDSLQISAGGRFDSISFTGIDDTKKDGSGFSGNVSASYEIADILTLRAGYSHVWGGVSLAENFTMNPAWDYSGAAVPVEADNFIAGAELNIAGVMISGEYFRTNLDNARLPSYRGGPFITRDLDTEGFNLAARYDWLSGFAQVSFADVSVKVDGTIADSYTGQYLATPLGSMFEAELSQAIGSTGFSVGGDATFALENKDTIELGYIAQTSYQVVNLFIGYKPPSLPGVDLRLSLRNLFDETYANRASYGQEFASVKPLLEQGQSVRFNARFQF